MPFDSYTALQTSIVKWIGNASVATRAPDFITLCEARLNRLIIAYGFGQVATKPIVADTEWVALPTDFGAGRLLTCDGNPQTVLKYKPPEWLILDHPYGDVGKPVAFTIHGQEIQLRPIPDGAYTLRLYYYKLLVPLGAAVATNWMLAHHPDLYLYGSLLEASPYLKDHPDAQLWVAGWDRASSEIINADQRRHWSGGTITQRPNAPKMVRGM